MVLGGWREKGGFKPQIENAGEDWMERGRWRGDG